MTRLAIPALALTVVGALWWLSSRAGSATVIDVANHVGEETELVTLDADEAPIVAVRARGVRLPAASVDPPTELARPARAAGERCVVTARVIDGLGGAALAGFRVALEQPYREETRSSFTTDADGRFETPAAWQAGVLLFEHEPSAEYPGDWRIITQAFSLPEGLREREVELVARHADHVVTVEVVLPDGAPAVGARVMRVLSAPEPEGQPRWRLWSTSETDAQGRARMTLLPEEALVRALAFTLREPFEGHVADRLVVPPPVGNGPWQLQLYRGGSLEVRVVDAQGVPVDGTEVHAYLDDRVRVHRDPPRTTDSGGVVRYGSLAAGRYFARTRFSGADEWVAEAEVELAHGGFETVELVISTERMPRVAAAGTVLDAAGQPVEYEMLLARLDDGAMQRVFSRGDGSFEFLTAASGERVHLRVGASVYSEPYAPAERSVDFGTTGLEFKKTIAMESVVALFELADARSGELLSDAIEPALVLYREPAAGEPVGAVSRFGLSDGVSEVDFLPHADLHYWVTAPGYSEARGRVRAPGPDGAPKLHRIELQPGFERELEVRDAVDGALMAGARFIDESGRTLGVSDARGEVRLSAGEWPGALTVEREGYAPLEWDPGRYWMNFERTLFLSPE